jgi:hypothetical protein
MKKMKNEHDPKPLNAIDLKEVTANFDFKSKVGFTDTDSIKRWLDYQTEDSGDADSTELGISALKEATLPSSLTDGATIGEQPNSPQNYEVKLPGNPYRLRGDDMTSALSLVMVILRDNGSIPPRSQYRSKVQYLTENKDLIATALQESNTPALSELLGLYTAIGNQILVPMRTAKDEEPGYGISVNQSRSSHGRGFNTDYADVFLSAIRNYYLQQTKFDPQDVRSCQLSWLLKNEKTISLLEAYLDEFETWETFVQSQCLAPYLDERLVPKLLWRTHKLVAPGLPDTLAELEECAQNAVTMIRARGKLIVSRLHEKGAD